MSMRLMRHCLPLTKASLEDNKNTLSSNIKFENVASHATIPIEENVIMWL